MTNIRKVQNMSTPASLGIEFTPGDPEQDDTRVQFAVPRETETVLFSLRGAGGHWYPAVVVVRPERFGPIPTNWAEMVAFAQAFDEGDSTD